jgi:hypothetical protein
LLDIFKWKVKGKIKKTQTCEWVKIEPVEGEKCLATTEEEFLNHKNLVEIFVFRTNILLQKSGWELSMKLGESDASPFNAWNDT